MRESTEDTLRHIDKVRERMLTVQHRVMVRGLRHDASKLEEPEKAGYDALQAKLAGEDYDADAWDVALAHHYAANSHHPEHYANGIAGMSLLDLIEMVADWKGASERHGQASIASSLVAMVERFGISEQLATILENTVNELGW